MLRGGRGRLRRGAPRRGREAQGRARDQGKERGERPPKLRALLREV